MYDIHNLNGTQLAYLKRQAPAIVSIKEKRNALDIKLKSNARIRIRLDPYRNVYLAELSDGVETVRPSGYSTLLSAIRDCIKRDRWNLKEAYLLGD